MHSTARGSFERNCVFVLRAGGIFKSSTTVCVFEGQYVCFSEELACTRRNVCILKSLCVSGQYVIYTSRIDDFLWVIRAVGVFFTVTHIY